MIRRCLFLFVFAASAALAAPSDSAPAAVDVVSAEFGVFDASNPREEVFEPTSQVPRREGQRYGLGHRVADVEAQPQRPRRIPFAVAAGCRAGSGCREGFSEYSTRTAESGQPAATGAGGRENLRRMGYRRRRAGGAPAFASRHRGPRSGELRVRREVIVSKPEQRSQRRPGAALISSRLFPEPAP